MTTQPKIPMSKSTALAALLSHDHGILGGDEAREIADVFGVKIRTYSITDTRSQFKGATLDGVNEGDTVEDLIAAEDLAMQICGGLGVGFADKFGRGAQLRECVAQLQESVL